MRVAVVTTSWPRFEGDPSGHFVQAEVRAIAQCSEGGERREVVVITPEGTPEGGADGDAFGWPGIAARVKESPLRLVGAARWVARAERQVREGGFDEVIAHWALPSAWPIAMSEGPALEVVSHGGDVRLLARLPGPLRAHLVTRIVRRAREWRFVSLRLLESLLAGLPRDAARALERVARVRPCAIDLTPPMGDAVLAKRALIGAPFAVCVARLVASKRVDAAIAWARARDQALVIVGDGPERAALERAAEASGARVHFAGRTTRPEALAWIASSAELVQPSRAEGLSTVVREAELLGVPVVAI